MNILIMGGGVAGQRLGANKWFDPEVVGSDNARQMRGHIVDPNLPLREFTDLNYMRAALRDGRLTVGHHIPAGHHFDVSYIASPTGRHMESLSEVNDLYWQDPQQPERWVILEKPLVSGIYEEGRLRTMLENGLNTERIYVHEPYLLSRGIQRLRQLIAEQHSIGNPPTAINVWSAKDRTPDVLRGRTGNDSPLGAYGIEFPHTHGAASLLAGVELGPEQVHNNRNIYYKNIDDNPLSEGTYTEFVHQDTIIRVAQGLGPFIMTPEGNLLASPRPGITRAAEVLFTDGQRAHLDLRPAFDRRFLTTERPRRHTVWTRYDSGGSVEDREYLPDYPIRTLITNVIDKIHTPDTPSLSEIGVEASLERCVAIRKLREQADIQEGISPAS